MRDHGYVPYIFPNDPFGKYGFLPSDMDPLGQYTGLPKEFQDIPVQDADDLS